MNDDPRIPPEYRGQTWEQRTTDGVIQSPFPPATIGIPSEDFEPFRDFQTYQWGRLLDEHPEYFCRSCGVRFVGCLTDGKGINVRDAQGRLVMAELCGACRKSGERV